MSSNGGESNELTPGAAEEPSTHPLTSELAAALRGIAPEPARVLLLGIGSGRNVPPLLDAGARVDVVEADPERALGATRRFAADARVRIARMAYRGPFPFTGGYAAALSTHALLHGTPGEIAAALAATRDRLAAGACLYATLGSRGDPRFGIGARIDDATFAAQSGSEAGVAHAYFDEPGVRALLGDFAIEYLAEVDASRTAGRWAHTAAEAANMVHWFARARRR